MGLIKRIGYICLGLSTIILLSACSIELTNLPETKVLQQYTISGLPQLNNSNLAASLTVDDVLEFSVNDTVLQVFESDGNLQIPPFTFAAYPEDKITLRAKNLNKNQLFTGCGIGEVYLLTSNKSYQLSESKASIVCLHNEIFYSAEYELSNY